MPLRHALVVLPSLALALAGFLQLPASEPEAVKRPKLVVLAIFDQMRGDYVQKWQPLFSEGGFKRLQRDGASFTNCHYPYCYTLTAPGHTSLVTGTNPARHGIISNDWYDRKFSETVSSVTPPPDLRRSGLGPYRRTARTIGDVFLEALAGRGRMASLSIKDRAAILMAALRSQFVYWFDPVLGQFVTSPFYRDEAHPWVKVFNAGSPAEKFFDRDWTKLRADLDYAKFSGPDDFFAEGLGYAQGLTFPHPTLRGDRKKSKDRYYAAIENSPFGNDLLIDFAKTAIRAEKLGQTDQTDLLFLSFSSNDFVGHCWGPDSQEVLDMTLRSDRMISEFLSFLDETVGKNKYVFAVSADHGVCPLPEFAVRQGKKAGRAAPEILTTLAEAHLNETFLKGEKAIWLEHPTKQNPWIYFQQSTLKTLKLEPAKVERALADWFEKQPGIQRAITRSEVLKHKPGSNDPTLDAVRRSFHPESSGDVMVVLEPYHLFSPPLLSKDPTKIEAYRTSHGTPHSYDTHVPLLVMGPGIRSGVYDERIAPQSLTAILCDLLKLPHPNDNDYPAPAKVLHNDH